MLAFALAALGGCGGGATVHYYLIDPEPGPVLRSDGPLAIEILDLEVPQYLERVQLASRGSGNEIDYATSHQWSEPLRKTLARVLAEHLIVVLATPEVATPHARLASTPQLRLQVHVDRFERGSDGRVELRGRWQLTDAEDGRVLATEAARITGDDRVGRGDYAALVASMQRSFAEFAQRIARSVAERAAGAPPEAPG
ncbi:MAG: PqiC family protein [Pseudomonadales bacterium]|jgi:uncharacterized lipoprotein YmbA|nr:PqiC family protein [Pseudomonadales bacterium]